MREDFNQLSKEELIRKILHQQMLLDELLAVQNSTELLNFPWLGNLGNWFWLRPENRVICNDQKITVLGYTREDAPDPLEIDFFTEKLHPDDYERVMDNMRQHLYGSTPAYETTYRIRTRSGDYIWFYDRGKVTRHDEAGRPVLISGIVFDVTEQKRMEELLAKQNQQLLELSTTDALTQLLNRRALDEKLEYEIRRAERYHHPLSLLMLDIDHFKSINDTYGHPGGDQVLVQVSSTIRRLVRSTDIVGRYGGEEFILILPECSLKNALKVAEKIRVTIDQEETIPGLRVTISGGIATWNGQTSAALVEAADRCLYKAKQNGRNRIEYPPIPMKTASVHDQP